MRDLGNSAKLPRALFPCLRMQGFEETAFSFGSDLVNLTLQFQETVTKVRSDCRWHALLAMLLSTILQWGLLDSARFGKR